jgi:hypothetical protein
MQKAKAHMKYGKSISSTTGILKKKNTDFHVSEFIIPFCLSHAVTGAIERKICVTPNRFPLKARVIKFWVLASFEPTRYTSYLLQILKFGILKVPLLRFVTLLFELLRNFSRLENGFIVFLEVLKKSVVRFTLG